MTIIKWYFLLFLASALLWPSVWAGDKYIYPIVWIVILFVAGRVMASLKVGSTTTLTAKHRVDCKDAGMRVRIPLIILLALIILSNAIYIGKTAIKQVGNNIRYAQGDRYAGYPPAVKQMFLDFERARELPAGVRIQCRKPELLFITSGRASEYPPGVSR